MSVSGLSTWLSSKEFACQWRRLGFNPWVGKIPWRRKLQPTPVFLPGKLHGQKSLVDYSPWDHKESNMTEWLSMRARTHTHTHIRCKYSIYSHFQARNVTSLNVELEEMHKVNLRSYMIWFPHTTCFLFCLEDITNIHTDGSTQMHIKASWICCPWYIYINSLNYLINVKWFKLFNKFIKLFNKLLIY